nr:glucose-1-phosphate adenylyltransferase [uncultured Agathobaculum sp.]
MYRKKECVAMLLAGGQGSRLYVLTKNVAKPAVPFGGKYRIIDFPLSNCVNSGIDTVGVLTQYEPHVLNAYIGSGQTWDLDRLRGGVYVLPPYQKGKTSEWYKGTANAIYQNIAFIDEYDPEYVLILSGDHIYKMNYNKMLQQHKETGADATIAVLDVPLAEASRFGIMNCKPDGTIYEFEEKPKQPKSTLASMGIYIFSWKKLRQYLIDDENNPKSSNDFGKDIIPAMLGNGEKLVSYRFEGYWKDVGTIESLWEANMDLLAPNSSGLNMSDDSWKIYGRTTGSPPHFTAKGASVKHTLLSEGCEIAGEVSESVLFSDVKIAKGANVEYSILMPGAVVEEGATVRYAIIAENAVIAKGAEVGGSPSDGDVDKWGVAVVAEGVRIGCGAKLAAKEMADEDLPDVK